MSNFRRTIYMGWRDGEGSGRGLYMRVCVHFLARYRRD